MYWSSQLRCMRPSTRTARPGCRRSRAPAFRRAMVGRAAGRRSEVAAGHGPAGHRPDCSWVLGDGSGRSTLGPFARWGGGAASGPRAGGGMPKARSRTYQLSAAAGGESLRAAAASPQPVLPHADRGHLQAPKLAEDPVVDRNHSCGRRALAALDDVVEQRRRRRPPHRSDTWLTRRSAVRARSATSAPVPRRGSTAPEVGGLYRRARAASAPGVSFASWTVISLIGVEVNHGQPHPPASRQGPRAVRAVPGRVLAAARSGAGYPQEFVDAVTASGSSPA